MYRDNSSYLAMSHPIWYNLCENQGGNIFHLILGGCFTKNTFCAPENDKSLSCDKKLKTSFGNVVSNVKMHLFANLGCIIMNIAMDLTIPCVQIAFCVMQTATQSASRERHVLVFFLRRVQRKMVTQLRVQAGFHMLYGL